MEWTFKERIHHAWERQGYASLKAFYEQHDFSFSYEYLRQIFQGQKTPEAEKVIELAQALKLDTERLLRLAEKSQVTQKLQRLYRKQRFRPAKAAEASSQWQDLQQSSEHQLLKVMDELDSSTQAKVLEYAQFLRKQIKQSQRRR